MSHTFFCLFFFTGISSDIEHLEETAGPVWEKKEIQGKKSPPEVSVLSHRVEGFKRLQKSGGWRVLAFKICDKIEQLDPGALHAWDVVP